MSAPHRPFLRPVAVALALLLGLLAFAGGAHAARPDVPVTPPVTGTLTGPHLVPTSSNTTYVLHATGGPAVTTNGTLVGKIAYTTNLISGNLTGTSVSPKNGTITNLSAGAKLVVRTGVATGPATLQVTVTSSLGSASSTANFSIALSIVVPYVLVATLVAGPSASVLPFPVTVSLDGTPVGTVQVPQLAPNGTYHLTYRYATDGLSPGAHTFVLSLAAAHGFVTFANGQTTFVSTFYIAPPASNDAVWYVAGTVAFFGALFIFATRLAARRRGTARR